MFFLQPRFSKVMLLFVPSNVSHLEMKHRSNFPYKMPLCPFPLLDSSLCHRHHKLHPEMVTNYRISCWERLMPSMKCWQDSKQSCRAIIIHNNTLFPGAFYVADADKDHISVGCTSSEKCMIKSKNLPTNPFKKISTQCFSIFIKHLGLLMLSNDTCIIT